MISTVVADTITDINPVPDPTVSTVPQSLEHLIQVLGPRCVRVTQHERVLHAHSHLERLVRVVGTEMERVQYTDMRSKVWRSHPLSFLIRD